MSSAIKGSVRVAAGAVAGSTTANRLSELAGWCKPTIAAVPVIATNPATVTLRQRRVIGRVHPAPSRTGSVMEKAHALSDVTRAGCEEPLGLFASLRFVSSRPRSIEARGARLGGDQCGQVSELTRL